MYWPARSSKLETFKANIIVKKKSRVVGKNFLKPAALKLHSFVRVIINPRFTDKERMPRGRRPEVLVHRQRIVNRSGGELTMETESRIDVSVKVQPQPIAHARVLLMRQRRKPRGWIWLCPAKDAVKSQTKIA